MSMTAALTAADLIRAAENLPRYPLAHLPTPLEFLPRFSKALGGPPIYIKRDDCTGLAVGGNKTRHNEFLIGDALKQHADVVVWGAGVQSNNCRQTAAACARAGLDCHLILGRAKPSSAPDPVQGNLLLDHLVGAIIDIVDEPLGPGLHKRITAMADHYAAQGRRPYAWDEQTVKPLAAVSYVLCMVEIVQQSAQLGIQPQAVYVSSAGSTGAGLALAQAALGVDAPIRNIAPLKWPYDTPAEMARIANDAARLMGIETRLERDAIDFTEDYIDPGYGVVSPGGLEAIALLARTEGILLDPIYTSKAMAGLIDHIRRERLAAGQPVVFVHTGGTPALFAYNEELARGIAPRRE